MARTIAVGVGGAAGMSALSWAVEEATRDDARLLVLHAGPLAARILARTEIDQRAVKIATGEPGPALAAAAREAHLLVIGAGKRGNTVREVIRHAHVPLVISRGTPGGRGATFADHVVVGVDGTEAARAALAFAFSYADLHHLPVAAAYVAPPGQHHLDRAAADRLRAEVEPWSTKYPTIRVRRTVLAGQVAAGLVRAGLGAHLLVVGDKHRRAVSRAWTGDVPFSVAHNADCPVAVIS